MRNSNTNSWRSTALIAGAILTAGVVTTTSTTNAHADDNQNNAQVSSNLSTYDQVRATADQQLAQLRSTNDSQEAQLATANEQANAADLAQVNDQIDQLNADHDALVQKQAGAIAQAQAETAASIADQTSVVNGEYQQQINAQQQNEAAQQAANDQQYAQAVSQNAEKQQIADGINAQYQQAVKDAANASAKQNEAANNQYSDAVASEDADYQAQVSAQKTSNASNIQNAQSALDAATKQAQQPHTVNVAGQRNVTGRVAQPISNPQIYEGLWKNNIPLEVEAYHDSIPVSAYEHPEFALTYYGEYIDATAIMNGTEAATPHDISEMPLTFKPGLICYKPAEDHSEEVPVSGLTASQIQTLRTLVYAWANDFRNEVYTNYRDFYNAVNATNGYKDVAPNTLLSTDLTDRIADQISAARTAHGIDNNTHSNEHNITDGQDYVSILRRNTNDVYQHFLATHQHISVTPSENLTTIVAGRKPTLLNYAINLYNSMQGMYYGELVTPQAIGGHAKNILRGDTEISAVGFQKVTGKTLTNDLPENRPVYAVTFDNLAYGVNHNAAQTRAFENDPSWGTSTVTNQLNAIKYAQGHTETVYTPTQVQPTADDVHQATITEQQKLAAAKDQAQQALEGLANNHQANLAQLMQQYQAAKNQIQANYKQAVAAADKARDNALKANNLVDLQAYKAELDAAYQNLVKADQAAAQKLAADRDAKIADIQKSENEKLAAKIEELAPSVQPQIQELLKQHQAVVAHGDAALAELKAANEAAYSKLEQQFNDQLAQIQQREAAKRQQRQIQLANATVVLPAQTTKNAAWSQTAGQPQATMATPTTTATTATNQSATVAPVATTVNQTAAVKATPAAASETSSATANNTKATKAAGSEKSAVTTKKDDNKANAVKQTAKKEATKNVAQSSMSLVALAATALLGTVGLTYSTKKRHN